MGIGVQFDMQGIKHQTNPELSDSELHVLEVLESESEAADAAGTTGATGGA
ncbi:hypothetical protein ACWD5R_21310 [Streptomyces sp. NPDC002514]|uniref:hypothetical protein n=1 Tax=unclassified Streptomyces TaxID=2593676 RepID=UPI00367569EA